jgi:predicted nucleotidyltransferase
MTGWLLQTPDRGAELSKNPQIMNVIHQIVDHIQPERIFIFGSHAKGLSNAESDLDLLVIYSGPLSKREVQLAIRLLFPEPNFGMDIFVMCPQQFDQQRHVPNALAREVAATGIVCYER